MVPLTVVRAIRAVGGGESPLAARPRPTTAATLENARLRELLDGVELGTWALGPRSIDEVVRTVREVRPEAVLEFGSGSSTVVLAWAIREIWGGDAPRRIVSVEQDETQAERTRSLLSRAGLDDQAMVVVAPLAEQEIEGDRTTCYLLPGALVEAVDGRPVDLVLIDGPAGPAGVRFGTLPLARPIARVGARFVLDDALRDGELDIARRWSRLPYARVSGIRLIEHGLLVGTMTA